MVNEHLPDKEIDLKSWWEEKDIMSKLSDQELIILVRLGMKWQQQQGAGSWCGLDVLLSAAKIPDENWTVNRLKTYAKCGTNAIIYSLLPNMVPVGAIERVNEDRYDRYRVTEAGRNVFTVMYTYCDTCNNNRKCIRCNEDRFMLKEPGTNELPNMCEHVFMDLCKLCNGTGKTTCETCKGKETRVDWQGNEIQCWNCNVDGTNTYLSNCGRCHGTNECKRCENSTRRKYCNVCNKNRDCHKCQSIKEICLS